MQRSTANQRGARPTSLVLSASRLPDLALAHDFGCSLDGAMSMEDWQRPALERRGFAGWVTGGDWPPSEQELSRTTGGVYVLYRETLDDPVFLDVSTGAQHKRRDPTITREDLLANWVDQGNVVYIGKGDHLRLRNRLNEYRDMGVRTTGKHWGGRLIWQLADSAELRVAYKELPASVAPREIEKQMITAFKRVYGKPPFANDPHRLGH